MVYYPRIDMRIISVLMVVIMLCGCAGTATTNSSSPAEVSAVTDTFERFSQHMVKGEFEKAYQYLSADYQMKVQSHDEFIKDCAENKAISSDYRSAHLKNISVEDNEASARLIWGTGDETLIGFNKEGKDWKIARTGSKLIRRTP